MNNRVRILLVDDNPDDRARISAELAAELPNLELKEVFDAAGLTQALERGEFDLVITDYQLSWSNGLEVLLAIKAKWEKPVIMFTSTGNEEVAVAAMKAGLDDYVIKSVKHFVRLRETTRLVLERASRRRSLEADEMRYGKLFDTVPIGLFVIAPDGQLLEANPAMVKVLGYDSRETLFAMNVRDFHLNHEDATRCLTKLQAEGEIFDLEVQLGRPDGTTVWLLTSARATRDPGGAPLYYHGAVEDITARKRAEEARRESEQRFETFMNKAPMVAFIKDAGGRHEYVNEPFLRLFKKTLAEVEGKTDSDLFPPEVAKALLEHDQLVLLSGRTLESTESVPTPDGVLHSWLVIKFPMMDSEERQFIGGVAIDITERQRAEEAERRNEQRFRDLFESSPEAIFVEDLYGNVLDANPAACRLHGLASAELIGKNIIDLVPVEKRGEVVRDFPRLARGEIVHLEGMSVAQDGHSIPVAISAGRIEYQSKPALLLHVRDMSEHQRLQEQFLQSQKMQAMGRLAGGIAHDFNNLLTAIIGYDELLLFALQASEPLHGYAFEIKRAADRATKLTKQLLAFSRKQTLQPRVIDLNTSVAEVETMLRRLIGDHVQLITQPAPSPACVRADPGQIEQVLLNLAVNGRDAMPEGGRLTVRIEQVTIGVENATEHPDVAAGDYLLLSVADSGTGMSDEVKQRLFEPFFTTKEEGKGTGLGLATCYGIVEQSGGRIAFESEPAQGSTFFIYLPRVEDHPELVPRPEMPEAMPRGSETLVFAEDSPSVRALGARVLRELGYTVYEAENGKHALQVIAEIGNLDLLVTDVMMPQMGGKQLVERFRAERANTKVLFNSGSMEDDMELREALDQAGTGFLNKPFTPADLARKVREVLDH